MSTTVACRERYRVRDIHRIFESGVHRSGSADIKVLEFFLKPLVEGRLEDEAVVEYGMHLEQRDVKFIGPWVQAMYVVSKRNPAILKTVRLRPNLQFDNMLAELQVTSKALTWFQHMVGEKLRAEYAAESSTNERLLELVQRLDHPT